MLEPTQEDAITECDEDSTPATPIPELRVCQSGSFTENVWLQDLRQQASQDEEYQQLKDVRDFLTARETYQNYAHGTGNHAITLQLRMTLLYMDVAC